MSYPVGFEMDYIERRSRLTTFFRYLLAIPHFIVLSFVLLAWCVTTMVAWFIILFTGAYPQGLYEFGVVSIALRVPIADLPWAEFSHRVNEVDSAGGPSPASRLPRSAGGPVPTRRRCRRRRRCSSGTRVDSLSRLK